MSNSRMLQKKRKAQARKKRMASEATQLKKLRNDGEKTASGTKPKAKQEASASAS